MNGSGRSVVAGVVLGLALALGGCGGGGGVGGCGSGAVGAPTISTCPPMATAGQSLEIFGTNLPGGATVVTFKNSAGGTKSVKANFGDDGSIDVTVPKDLAGVVTVTICGLSCTTMVAASNA
jgi:hypothetical protein